MTPFAVLLALTPASPADDTHFEREVRPVLVERCVKCHGPTKASGGLRLDSREALLKGGDSGPAVVPGRPADSRLVKAVRREKGVEPMPPDKALPPAAVAALEQWVRDGAAWPATAAPVRVASHWAFEPVRPRTPPPGAHPIDAFLGAKPQAAVDRRTLIRRVTFDLTGLPPTPGGDRRLSRGRRRRRRSRRWWTGCWPRRTTARSGAGTGWTSSATPTRPATTADYPVPRRLAVPQLRHRRLQPRHALRPVPPRAARRRHTGREGADRSGTPSGSRPPGTSPRPPVRLRRPQGPPHLTSKTRSTPWARASWA